jgi:hypothetical protein
LKYHFKVDSRQQFPQTSLLHVPDCLLVLPLPKPETPDTASLTLSLAFTLAFLKTTSLD